MAKKSKALAVVNKKSSRSSQQELNHYYHEIGLLVKNYREQKALTQISLSRMLGFENPMFVSLVERGKAKVPLTTMGKLVVLLGIPESEVVKLSLAAYQFDLQAGVQNGMRLAIQTKKQG